MGSRSASFPSALALLLVLLVPGAAPLVSRALARAPAPPPAAVEAQGEQAPTEAKAIDPAQPRTARELIEEYLGAPLSGATDRPWPRVRVLIVDVPDPIDSHLDWAYDASVVSLRRALEVTRNVTDRFWLPWSVDAKALRDRKAPTYLRRDHPGVMLFRAAHQIAPGAAGDLLHVVLLVGETPTSGVHKGALRAALAQVDSLRALTSSDGVRLVADADTATLRLVAPYFTGAATSVRQILAGWRATHASDRLELVSGSATQLALAPAFAVAPLGACFRATVNADDDLMHTLVTAVRDRLRVPAGEVAILQESSTEYGQQARDAASAPDACATAAGASLRGAQVTTAVDPGTAADTATTAAERHAIEAREELARYTVIPFPMNVATLRDEAEANGRAPSEAQPPGGRRAPFALSLRESGSSTERPPAHSPLTAAAVSLLIEQIAATLTERNVRAVGIIATDVRDKIFLAREVRRRLPDVQLFTTESNLFYLWPEYNEVLRGMIVATSYPLFLDAAPWGGEATRGGGLLAFQDEAAVGMYNAILLQIGRPEQLRDYGLRAPATRPPVWLTSVGRRSFFPISVDTQPAFASRFVREAAGPAGSPAPAAPAGEARVVAQAGQVMHTVIKGDSVRSLAIAIFLLATFVAAGYVVSESWRGLGAHRKLGFVTGYRQLPLHDLRREVYHGSLLLHLQLYSMLRALALGCVVVVGAVLLLRDAHDGRLLGDVAPEARVVPAVLAAIALGLVAWSAYWMLRVGRRTLGAGMEYLLWRRWDDENARRPAAQWVETRLERLPFRRLLSAGLPDAASITGERAATGRPSLEMVRSEPEDPTTLRAASSPSEWGQQERRRRAALRHSLWAIEFLGRAAVFVVAVLFTALVLRFLSDASADGLTAVLFFHRAVQLGSGVSPALPVLVCALGFVMWCTWHLARIHLLRKPIPFELACDATDEVGSLVERTREPVRRVRERLFLMVPDGAGVVMLVILLLLGLALFVRFDRSMEAMVLPPVWGGVNAFDLLLPFGVLASIGALAWALYRFWMVWRALQALLEELETSPLLPAFERVPRRLAQLSRLTLRRMLSREGVIAVTTTQWGHLRRIHSASATDKDFSALPAATRDEIASLMGEAENAELLPECGPFGGRAGTSRLRRLFAVIERCWQIEPLAAQVAMTVERAKQAKDEATDGSTSGQLRRAVTDAPRLWLRAAEETAAVQVVAYIEWVLRHLRVLAFFILVSLVLTTVLLNGYPFQPQSAIKLVFVVLMAASVGSLLLAGTQMNRNDVLSRITRGDPGRINWDASYVWNLILFGVVPVITYVGADVRPVRDGLLSWLEPLLRALTQH